VNVYAVNWFIWKKKTVITRNRVRAVNWFMWDNQTVIAYVYAIVLLIWNKEETVMNFVDAVAVLWKIIHGGIVRRDILNFLFYIN